VAAWAGSTGGNVRAGESGRGLRAAMGPAARQQPPPPALGAVSEQHLLCDIPFALKKVALVEFLLLFFGIASQPLLDGNLSLVTFNCIFVIFPSLFLLCSSSEALGLEDGAAPLALSLGHGRGESSGAPEGGHSNPPSSFCLPAQLPLKPSPVLQSISEPPASPPVNTAVKQMIFFPPPSLD